MHGSPILGRRAPTRVRVVNISSVRLHCRLQRPKTTAITSTPAGDDSDEAGESDQAGELLDQTGEFDQAGELLDHIRKSHDGLLQAQAYSTVA